MIRNVLKVACCVGGGRFVSSGVGRKQQKTMFRRWLVYM